MGVAVGAVPNVNSGYPGTSGYCGPEDCFGMANLKSTKPTHCNLGQLRTEYRKSGNSDMIYCIVF